MLMRWSWLGWTAEETADHLTLRGKRVGLLHMDMLVQVAVVDKSVELRSGLVSEASCSLTT